MTISIGDTIPNIEFQFREGDTRPEQGTCPIGGKFITKSSNDIFANKRVIIFSLPGAFTPTCSTHQLPGFDQNFETFKKEGIDEIFVVSVNDAFVMNAWSIDCAIKNIKTIPDGNGEFTSAMGMSVAKSNFGFGQRSWRYAAIINNCKIEKIFEEPGKTDNYEEDPYGETSPENLLSYLQNSKN